MEYLTNPPPLLCDMRWVYDHPKKAGEEESLVNCRAMLKASPKLFMERLARLESDWMMTEKAAQERAFEREKAGQIREGDKAVEEVDEGTERLRELIQGLLSRCVG